MDGPGDDYLVLKLPGLAPEDSVELEEALASAVGDAGVGEYDGNGYDLEAEVLEVFFYGPDADALLQVVTGVVSGCVPAGSVAEIGTGQSPEVETVAIG